MLNVDKESLESAPGFDKDNWPDMADPKSSKSIISCTVKLKLRPAQERILTRWLWHLTGVYNWIDADEPLLSLRIGEEETPSGYLERYHTITGSAHYLHRRNIRFLAEAGWDIERETPRFALGTTLAW